MNPIILDACPVCTRQFSGSFYFILTTIYTFWHAFFYAYLSDHQIPDGYGATDCVPLIHPLQVAAIHVYP